MATTQLNNPKVTVITPTFNHQHYIAEAIVSVLDQTYQNWELVIVDDGSTDNTPKVCAKFLNIDPRIHYYYQDNVGLENLANTYNFALENSTGEIVSILEGDDLWHPDHLSITVEKLKRDRSILCWGVATNIDHKGIGLGVFPQLGKVTAQHHNSPVGSFLKNYLFRSTIPSPSISILRENLMQIGGFQQPEGMQVVDYPTVLELTLKGKFSFMAKPTASYRVFPQQASSSGQVNPAAAAIYAYRFFEKNRSQIHKTCPEITESKLKKSIAVRSAQNNFFLGRTCLSQNRTKEAENFFKRCFATPTIYTCLLGLFGLSALFFNLDIEKIVRKMGKRPIA